MKSLENLCQGQVVAAAGAAQAGKKWRGYENDFFAALQKLGRLVKHRRVYDCLVVTIYKVFNLSCNNRINY